MLNTSTRPDKPDIFQPLEWAARGLDLLLRDIHAINATDCIARPLFKAIHNDEFIGTGSPYCKCPCTAGIVLEISALPRTEANASFVLRVAGMNTPKLN